MPRTMLETALLDVPRKAPGGKEVSGQKFLEDWINKCRAEHNHGDEDDLLIETETIVTESQSGTVTRMNVMVTCMVCRPFPRAARRKTRTKRRKTQVPQPFRELTKNRTDLPEEPTI